MDEWGGECGRFYGAQIPFRTNRHWRIGVKPHAGC
jgi:hypothetical protein